MRSFLPMKFTRREVYRHDYLKSLCVFFLLVLITFTPRIASSTLIEFSDPGDSGFATAIRGINLTSYGFNHYDVLFVSARQETVDGWNAVSAAYAPRFTADVYPNVPDSQMFSHLIKRAIVRAFNALKVDLVSGIAGPGGTTFEHHTTSLGEQSIRLPYRMVVLVALLEPSRLHR